MRKRDRWIRFLAYVEACGAVFAAVPEFPNWFEARWVEPTTGEDWRFAARLGSKDDHFAQAFRDRASA
jgi:hypothetical protein